MSGIEIIIIVGAGYLITKKIKQNRAAKRQQQLGISGVAPHGHGEARVVENPSVRGDKRQTDTEEPLPLYTGPSDGTQIGEEKSDLPSYDSLDRGSSDPSSNNNAEQHTNEIEDGAGTLASTSAVAPANDNGTSATSSKHAKQSRLQRLFRKSDGKPESSAMAAR